MFLRLCYYTSYEILLDYQITYVIVFITLKNCGREQSDCYDQTSKKKVE